MEASRRPSARNASEITVYPVFCSFPVRKENLVDGPWLCEDDEGRLAFLSEEAKLSYLNRPRHSISSHMERSH